MSKMYPLDVVMVRENVGSLTRNFTCPECGRHLPIDRITECDRCGSHLSLHVRVDAPAVTGGKDTQKKMDELEEKSHDEYVAMGEVENEEED